MTEDAIRIIVQAVAGILLALNTSILWGMRDLVKKHDQTLYGERGDNGLKGAVGSHGRRLHEHADKLTNHEYRLLAAEQQRGDR